jgi:hemolysin III
MKAEDPTPLIKPLLRGHFHQAAFFVAIGACSVLLLNSLNSDKVLATVIYSLSQIVLFGTSALYHRRNWQVRARTWMRRLDHAAIYVSIAGTSTPICMIALNEELGTKLLSLVWITAFFGIIQSLLWVKAPKWVSAILYISVSLLMIPSFPQLKDALGPSGLSLILIGGIAYIVGAIIYALKRPNPYPKTFGYHEIFHLLVIVGACFHFLLIYRLI